MELNSSNMAAWLASTEEQRKKREDEEMTHYSDNEIAGDWEFKIVRSSIGTFKDPKDLAKPVEEEAELGWELFEKLDNERVRFKRHVRERSRDRLAGPDRDPYRSVYGALSLGRRTKLFLGILLITLGIIFVVVNVF